MNISESCMCDWKPGEIKENLESFKKLVEDPKYICQSCGRASSSEKSLCDPVPLSKN